MLIVAGDLQPFRDNAEEWIKGPLPICARLSEERGLAWSQQRKEAQIVGLLAASPASG